MPNDKYGKPIPGGWNDVGIEALTGGLNTSTRPELVANTDLLHADNITLRQSKIVRDTGYKPFGSAVRGIPQTDYQYFRRNGISLLVLITTSTVYQYIVASNQWQYVQGAAGSVSTIGEIEGSVQVNLLDASGFSDGDFIGIALDDGSQHQTTVNGTPVGNLLQFNDPIPAGRYIPINAVIVVAVVLNGNLDSLISIDTVPSEDWVVFTNGVDLPMRYDSLDCVPLPNLPSGLVTCRVLINYNSSLFMMNTIEGGLSLPQRIRRTDIGNPTDWSGGLAGFDDMYDAADFIVCAIVMGPYLMVYRERSMLRGQFVNTGGKTYAFDATVSGEGAVSSQSVVDLNSKHLLFGNAGIYEYTGGYDLESIDDNVFYLVFSYSGDINNTYKHRVFGFYVEELDEAWFFYPSIGHQYPNVLLRYNASDKSWVRRKFDSEFIGFGFYQTLSTNRWVDLVGSWTAQTWQWNSRTVSVDAPTTHLMGPDSNMIMEYDYLSTTDNGAPITAIFETVDFFNKDWAMRHDTFQFYAKGQDITVEYSTDAGASYSLLGIVSSTILQIHTLSRQFVCDKIRYRISCSDINFEFGWLHLDYFEESSTMYRAG